MTFLNNWPKWTQLTGKFPENKYDFVRYLKREGDYVISHPMSLEDFNRIKNAAYHWAWYHRCRVKTKKMPTIDGQFRIMITLDKLHRTRSIV